MALLVALLCGLCVWYGSLSPAPAVGAYPGNANVGSNPNAYVGAQVAVGGTVVDTDPVRIELLYGGGSVRRLTVHDVDTDVTEGETLRVFGTLTDPATVQATFAFATEPSGFLYSYVVSFLAGLWVLFRLVVQWRVDVERGLVRRASPLSPYDRLRQLLARTDTEGTDTDA